MGIVLWLLLSLISGDANNLLSETQIVSERLPSTIVITPQGDLLIAEIADNQASRNLGLSYREFLKDDQGMLFIFDHSDHYSFWMKDMNFSIDIIWLNNDKEIVWIEQNVSPDSYPTLWQSKIPARYVLEVNAGISSELDLKVGDNMSW